MAYSDEIFFKNLEIRDILDKVSDQVYAGAFIPKTILFKNELDQDVNIDIFGCSKIDTTTHYKINTLPIVVLANTHSFETLDDYFQCFFLHVKAETVPTTGQFSSEMLMTSGNGD